MPRQLPSRFPDVSAAPCAVPRALLCAVLCTAFAATALAPAAHALEQVNLRNGFSVQCSHHDVLGPRIRLYLGPGDANYQDIPVAEVTGIVALPDPPPPATVAAAAPTTSAAGSTDANPSRAEMRSLLLRAGAEHDIDAELLASVIHAESDFRVNAVSRAGARGLMQLMPSTARNLGVRDLNRADQNIAGGTAYLDSLLTLYKNNLALALAAYNAGPAAVARYHGIPPFRETRAYVARVMNEFYRRKTAQQAAAAQLRSPQQAATAQQTSAPTLLASR